MTSYGSVLFIAGIGIIGGLLTALLFRRLTVPQVLGYIAVGVILGQSGFGIISGEVVHQWQPFNFFALGVIGFIVGSSIKAETLKRYGRQFLAILICEGILAFLLVGIASTLIMYSVMHSWVHAAAAGIVFAAIASATDPASTINVLKEYRAAGILTTTLFAIVAFDDALAMMLYGIGSGVSRVLSGGDVSVFVEILVVAKEVFGSLLLGGMLGYCAYFILARVRGIEYHITALIGLLSAGVWICISWHMDVILATMAMGVVVTHLSQGLQTRLLEILEIFSSPVYVLFFIMVGARMQIGRMPVWMGLLVASYIVFRSLGKVAGAWIGARRAHSDPMVARYTGMALFSQGGVAIGLAMMASHHLNDIAVTQGMSLGDVIIFCVTVTTFFVQIIGPPMVKFAASRAGETGRDITQQDIISRWKVADVMDRSFDPLYTNTTIRTIVSLFTLRNYSIYPVLSPQNALVGVITMQEIRDLLIDQQTWDWIVASDVMREPHREVISSHVALEEALQVTEQVDAEELIAVRENGLRTAIGIVNKHEVKHKVNAELLTQRSY